MEKALYKKLGLNNIPTLEEVKKAYKKLALKYHPDVNPKGLKKFLDIQEAYEKIVKQLNEPPKTSSYEKAENKQKKEPEHKTTYEEKEYKAYSKPKASVSFTFRVIKVLIENKNFYVLSGNARDTSYNKVTITIYSSIPIFKGSLLNFEGKIDVNSKYPQPQFKGNAELIKHDFFEDDQIGIDMLKAMIPEKFMFTETKLYKFYFEFGFEHVKKNIEFTLKNSTKGSAGYLFKCIVENWANA